MRLGSVAYWTSNSWTHLQENGEIEQEKEEANMGKLVTESVPSGSSTWHMCPTQYVNKFVSIERPILVAESFLGGV